MRILLHPTTHRHPRPGLKIVEEDRPRIVDERLGGFAPELDQSGVSHSLSLNDPLRLRGSRPAPLRGAENADRLA